MKRRFAFSILRVNVSRACVVAAIAACVCVSISTPAYSQRAADYKAISGFDTYGNARSIRPARRPIGLFQNETQREMLRGYQINDRREGQRGGVSPFALSMDQALGMSLAPTFSSGFAMGSPRPTTATAPNAQQSFAKFGGFSDRTAGPQIGDAQLAFTRKKELIQATSLNAPIRRAFWESGVALGIRTSVEQTPFLQHDSADQPDETQKPTLDEKLVKQVTMSHARSRQQAWGWFSEGDYRRAVRSFESAISLETDDVESRIGLLFSHLSLGATQTAFAVLREIHRRDIHPFELDLLITDRFGDASSAQRLVFQLRNQAQRYPNNTDVMALYAMMLWLTGDRDEAINAMERVDRKETRSPYDDWLRQMQAVHSGRPSP